MSASSVQVVQDHQGDEQVGDGVPVRPTNPYGVTKCYGEALCACYANREILSTIVLRIGDFRSCGSAGIENTYGDSVWMSAKNVVDRIVRPIEVNGVDFFIAA